MVGSLTRLADGRYDVRFRLWDVVKQQDQQPPGRDRHRSHSALLSAAAGDGVDGRLARRRRAAAFHRRYDDSHGCPHTAEVRPTVEIACASPRVPFRSPTRTPDGAVDRPAVADAALRALWERDPN